MHEGCEGGYEKRWSKSDYITARSNWLVEQSTLEFEARVYGGKFLSLAFRW